MGIIALNNGQFLCGRFCYSQGDIGKLIVNSLLGGTEDAAFGFGSVKVSYLVGMLRYAGKTGEFFDAYDHLIGSHDHDFDPNMPTPGARWSEVQDLRAAAKEADFQSREIGDINLDWLFDRSVYSAGCAELANILRAAADSIDSSKLGLSPLRKGLTMPTAKCWDKKVGTNAIWWNGEVFKFGGFYVSRTTVGRMIVNALLRREEKVLVGEIEVTVSYLVQMCREVGRHGKFAHFLDDGESTLNVAPDMGAAD